MKQRIQQGMQVQGLSCGLSRKRKLQLPSKRGPILPRLTMITFAFLFLTWAFPPPISSSTTPSPSESFSLAVGVSAFEHTSLLGFLSSRSSPSTRQYEPPPYSCPPSSRVCSPYSILSRRITCLYMAKGDGKKRRKKASDSSSSSSSSSSSASSAPSSSTPTPAPQQPMRVSNDINIPIRRQIEYGKLNKQIRQTGTTAFRQKKVQRTKYRRTWDEEEIEQKAEERKRKGQDPDWDVILNQTTASPLVIVDGYNIIYKWPRLKKHIQKGDAKKSRQLLVDDLESLSSLKAWRIEVVFDGTARNFRKGALGDSSQRVASAADRASTKEVSTHGVRQVFTGVGVEADSYIESRCAEAKNVTEGAITNTFIIATDDAMIRLAGQNAGALCMSADRFVNELKAVHKAMAYRVEAAMAKVNGEAMRPEKLWGTNVFAASSASGGNKRVVPSTTNTNNANTTTSRTTSANNANNKNKDVSIIEGVQKTSDGRSIYTGRFGRGSLIIEDKRKKKKK